MHHFADIGKLLKIAHFGSTERIFPEMRKYLRHYVPYRSHLVFVSAVRPRVTDSSAPEKPPHLLKELKIGLILGERERGPCFNAYFKAFTKVKAHGEGPFSLHKPRHIPRM
jgi:hypothetical protein